ncbi:hypothetical protein CXB51_019975 [Gossypium anomalum]|uniref:RNase H type-1 domain-containing protein n=1 Tax=Gossypium anomalum TaxID=47600 RepID=A0A8J5ZEK1_9ROSI|nr:hypothetical protein CXB51_019975 [Gossypium anomalum]
MRKTVTIYFDSVLQQWSYISKLEGIEEKKLTLKVDRGHKYVDRRTNVAIYFDAAFDQQSFRSASRMVVQDVGGEILASKTVLYSDVASPFAVEAYAGLQAMRLGISMGFSILEIVGDSRTVIKKCQTTDFDRSVIGAPIRDIHSKKVHFQEIEFHFIPKTENTYAYILAKETLKNGEGHYLLGGVPGYVRRALEKS